MPSDSQSAECWNFVSRVRFKIFAGGPGMLTGSAADGVYRDSLMDELRRIELAVVEGERQLAEKEALLVSLKKQDGDVSLAELTLEVTRNPAAL